jgi:hypothetical protein
MLEKYSNMNIDKKKEIILSNIIGINPTGTLNYEGTYSMKGTNDIIMTPADASKISLEKAQNNEINCSNIEHFDNQLSHYNFKINYNYIIYLLIIIFILIILIFNIIYYKYYKK